MSFSMAMLNNQMVHHWWTSQLQHLMAFASQNLPISNLLPILILFFETPVPARAGHYWYQRFVRMVSFQLQLATLKQPDGLSPLIHSYQYPTSYLLISMLTHHEWILSNTGEHGKQIYCNQHFLPWNSENFPWKSLHSPGELHFPWPRGNWSWCHSARHRHSAVNLGARDGWFVQTWHLGGPPCIYTMYSPTYTLNINIFLYIINVYIYIYMYECVYTHVYIYIYFTR